MSAFALYAPLALPGLAQCHLNAGLRWRARVGALHRIPLYSARAACGFPSPADDHVEGVLDLNDLCIGNATATFFVRAEGDSMRDAGIEEGDLLVVDRSLTPVSGDVVIACVDGEMTVKRFVTVRGRPLLCPASDTYPVLHLAGREWECWGVVTFTIKRQRHARNGP
jgi:DNA polymerase V